MKEDTFLDLIDSIYAAAVDPDRYKGFLEILSEAIDAQMNLLMTQEAHTNPVTRTARGGLPTGNEDSSVVQPVCSHSYNQATFADADLAQLQALQTHLRRSREVQKRLALDLGRQHALDSIPSGCVLLGKDGNVLAMNQAANRILSACDGFLYAGGRVDASAAESSRRLREMIDAATSGKSTSLADSMCRVLRRRDAQPYAVFVTPFAHAAGWTGLHVQAALFISDPDGATAEESVGVQLFGLTRAEARMARALANGEGLGQAAAKLDIGINTAKTHLQRIFAKTHTCRQAELVRLLAHVDAISAPPEEPTRVSTIAKV